MGRGRVVSLIEKGSEGAVCAFSVVAVQHPGILGAATLRGIHHERSLLQRDAGEAARRDRHLLAVEDVGAQVDMASLESPIRVTVTPGRVARE